MKKTCAIILAVIMLLMAIPFSVMAEEAAEPVDLAAGKTPTASSTMEGTTTANATDSDRNSYWASEKFPEGGDQKSWLEVDLGAVCDLTQVIVRYPLTNEDKNGLSNPWIVTIYAKSTADGEWTKVGILDDKQNLLLGLESATWWVTGSAIDLDEGTKGRYVKVELEGMKDDSATKDAHRICQLVVMGIPGEGAEVQEPTEAPAKPVDLAAGKKPTASSTMAGTTTANATDDDRASFWASEKFEVTGTDKSWLELDLGSKYPLTEVIVRYPIIDESVNGHSNPWIINIYTKSTADGEWVKVGGVDDKKAIILDPTGEPSWWVTGRAITLDEGAEGRYVKVELEGMKDDMEGWCDAHRVNQLVVMGYDTPSQTGDTMSSLIVVVPVLALCGLAVTVIFRKKFGF